MHSELVALTSACLASSLCSWRKYQCRRLLSSLELLVRAGSYRPVWEISNTAAVMVFAQMRTLSIGAACEFTRGSEHFAPLPSQSRVTRRGWLASLSLSSFFSFRPPSSRPSPAASDCLGPAGATLTAKTDHVSCRWGETKLKGLLTTTKLPTCYFFWIVYYEKFTHSSHTFVLMFQNLCNGNCETVGPEGGGKLGGSHVPWTFHAPSHSVAYCRDCNKSEKGSLKFKFTIFGGPALPQNFMSHRIVFSFAWLVEIWECA